MKEKRKFDIQNDAIYRGEARDNYEKSKDTFEYLRIAKPKAIVVCLTAVIFLAGLLTWIAVSS